MDSGGLEGRKAVYPITCRKPPYALVVSIAPALLMHCELHLAANGVIIISRLTVYEGYYTRKDDHCISLMT